MLKPRSICTALLVMPLALAACQSGSSDTQANPAAMNSNDAALTDRTRAVRQAGDQLARGEGNTEATRESLKNVIWRRANYWKLRATALDALLRDEANIENTRRMLALLLPTESAWRQWDMIEHISEIASDRGWTDLTPGFVVSYARRSPSPTDEERPERTAILALHPGRPLPDIVFEVFVGSYGGVDLRERDRLAAWGLLQRVDPDARRTTVLLAELDPVLASADPLVESLHATATDLHAVPRTGEELEWVQRLRTPENQRFWNECAQVIAGLSPAQLEGFAVRHAAGVRWAATNRPEWLAESRDGLMHELEPRLEPKKHYWRTGGSNTQVDESLRRARKKLVWGDLVLILIALDVTEDDSLAGELFAQADKDNGDTSTEYGGVIDSAVQSTPGEPRFVALPYPPRPAQRFGDNRFVASDDLLIAGVDALFHYHFHASSFDNRQYAGPSMGDLEYAKQYSRSAIVFTFANRNTLNADYYQPNGARLDLGVVERP